MAAKHLAPERVDEGAPKGPVVAPRHLAVRAYDEVRPQGQDVPPDSEPAMASATSPAPGQPAASTTPGLAVQMRGITKRFGAALALDNARLEVRERSIHAILGENGAGKTTLMNILYGLYHADEGEILIHGKPAHIEGPRDAIRCGIGMVHQHFMLVENFSIAENIILGDEVVGPAGVLDMRRARRQVTELVERYGFDVDPDARVEDISVGMQQRTEILKALYRGADILILDEPTAVLTPQEADKLIEIMHELVSSGKTIIIITHKLQEIMRSADECTIIRRGVWQGTLDVAQASEAELAARMVGHAVSLHVEKGPATPGDVVLDIRDLHVRDARGIEQVCGLDLSVRAGEIVGVAGIDGNGQSELVDAIMSLAHADAGSIYVAGEELQNTSPRQVIAHGVATIPSDRHRYGLVLPMSVMENAVLGYHANGSFGTGGRLDERRMHDFATRLIETYDIRPEGCEHTPISALSGGNQQKLIIGRSVESAPRLIVAFAATRGLDVGAIEFVHRTLVAERDRGAAVLLVSFELDEIMDLSDRIAVLYHGRIVRTFAQDEAHEGQLGLLMAGGEA